MNHEEAEALREVTAALIEIADQLEGSVVDRATQNLARKLLNAPIQVNLHCSCCDVHCLL